MRQLFIKRGHIENQLRNIRVSLNGNSGSDGVRKNHSGEGLPSKSEG